MVGSSLRSPSVRSERDEDVPTYNKPLTRYWSYQTLQEDKKRCLAELPHADHTEANTYEHLHEDKYYQSNKAIEERKKLHQQLRNDTWRRRPSTPTHPFVANADKNGQFWSHTDLIDSKRILSTTLSRPQSVRSPGSPGITSENSQNSRFDYYEDLPSGAKSPTMKELLQHQRALEDHPHNEVVANWWQTVREKRDAEKPHWSREKFAIRKKHHTTNINNNVDTKTPCSHYRSRFIGGEAQTNIENKQETPSKTMLYQRDPKTIAVQGVYPRCLTNEAWGPPTGTETPPSRYCSHEYLSLDKRRHATPMDGGCRRERFQKESDPQKRITGPVGLSPGETPRDEQGSKVPLYRSNFTLQQHKRKHLAGFNAGSKTDRGDYTRVAPGSPKSMFGSPKGSSAGRFSPAAGARDLDGSNVTPAAASRGFMSHRELEYCKRFNIVSLKPDQDIEATELPDRPWPKPGTGKACDDVVSTTSSTPAYPAAPKVGTSKWTTNQAAAYNTEAITHYTRKTGVPNDLEENQSLASDQDLLHSSNAEFTLRKGHHQTSLRHHFDNGSRVYPKEQPASARMLYSRESVSSDLDPKRVPDRSQAVRSQRQLLYSKALHKFGHDDPKRVRSQPTMLISPQPPVPRSGQWTPAHL